MEVDGNAFIIDKEDWYDECKDRIEIEYINRGYGSGIGMGDGFGYGRSFYNDNQLGGGFSQGGGLGNGIGYGIYNQ
jgi:hypothetical protein